ncbi:hypothetical protein D3Z38_14345 [Clostridiales bacterium]|nr:hypothetical protein [Clostridiales bacterium]
MIRQGADGIISIYEYLVIRLTDKSGIDHMEYNAENKPTVWAICPEVQAFLRLMEMGRASVREKNG